MFKIPDKAHVKAAERKMEYTAFLSKFKDCLETAVCPKCGEDLDIDYDAIDDQNLTYYSCTKCDFYHEGRRQDFGDA